MKNNHISSSSIHYDIIKVIRVNIMGISVLITITIIIIIIIIGASF